MSKLAGLRSVTLCAMAALITTSAPPALAIPPLPETELAPSPDACRALGFTGDERAEEVQSLNRGGRAGGMTGYAPPAPAMALMAAPPTKSSGYRPMPQPPYPPPPPPPYPMPGDVDRDRYADVASNPIKRVADDPVSTFSIDVDTASYSNTRRFLTDGRKPPADSVRVEELINYFDYDYAPPRSAQRPFEPFLAVAPSPWSKDRQIIHIGLQGYGIPAGEQPPLNLVFLIDTSGSMSGEDRLPLAKKALEVLIGQLGPKDRVAMVAYAGSAGAVLAPTQGTDKLRMRCALRALHSGGSTAGGEGLALAYSLAQQNFRQGAVNRVILLTDGDFNVGVADPEKLEDFVADKRKTGVYLSVYGFGRGNYNDVMMQTLAQSGNGTAAYIDTLDEGRKVFRDDFSKSLFPIADDVKIQVEFNPAVVSEYRLIGYETRMLRREDFNNDRVDAGEVGSGASVTALYEVALVGAPPSSDPLRYQPDRGPGIRLDDGAEYGFLKVRYKLPGASQSLLMSEPITEKHAYAGQDAPEPTRWALAVAGFGQKLRGDAWLEDGFGWDDIEALAQGARGADQFGLRAEFVRLVKAAKDGQSLNE